MLQDAGRDQLGRRIASDGLVERPLAPADLPSPWAPLSTEVAQGLDSRQDAACLVCVDVRDGEIFLYEPGRSPQTCSRGQPNRCHHPRMRDRYEHLAMRPNSAASVWNVRASGAGDQPGCAAGGLPARPSSVGEPQARSAGPAHSRAFSRDNVTAASTTFSRGKSKPVCSRAQRPRRVMSVAWSRRPVAIPINNRSANVVASSPKASASSVSLGHIAEEYCRQLALLATVVVSALPVPSRRPASEAKSRLAGGQPGTV